MRAQDEHFEITYFEINAEQETGKKHKTLARIGRPRRNVFPVAFLHKNLPEGEAGEKVLAAIRKELDFYLVHLGEARPWAYLRYHCSTAANIYSPVHWGYYPARRGRVLPSPKGGSASTGRRDPARTDK